MAKCITNKGSYILIINLPKSHNIIVGRLGEIHFSAGWYAYVGSAMRGFQARLPHHLRKSKEPHWHIDYLLMAASTEKILTFESQTKLECQISEGLSRQFNCIPGFGCSDCHCRSHLYFSNSFEKLETIIFGALGSKESINAYTKSENPHQMHAA
jgi:Uri superfamily endonuclease